MRPALAIAAVLALLVALVLAVVAAMGPEEPLPDFAVLTPAEAPELAAAVEGGWFFRWVLPELEAKVEVAVGPGARGERRIAVASWPLSQELAPLVADLPVGGDAETLRFAGIEYAAAGISVALRLPTAGNSGSRSDKGPDNGSQGGRATPEWLVLSRTGEDAAHLVSGLLASMATGRYRPMEAVDYLLRESPWLERKGRWLRGEEGWEVDPAHDDDGFARRRRWFHSLSPVVGEHLTLLVPPGRQGDGALRRLLAELDRAVAEMAGRIPLSPEQLGHPLIAVEDDFPSQVRHTGRLGEAVRGGPADLHLVYHPDDLYAYRHALALLLVERSGRLSDLPPWLARGAALWLSGDWFGRPYGEWLPAIAATGMLPDAATLLAESEQRDGSAPLWTPAAAAVVHRLPGETLAAKRGELPTRAALAHLLGKIQDEAGTSRAPAGANGPTPFLRGVSLAMLNTLDGGYHAPSVDERLRRLEALGANAVALMPFASQRDPRQPELRFLNHQPTAETDIGTLHAARRAHAQGMRVLWKPHLWVGHHSWPGEVAMTSDEDWHSWWASYRRYILHHAFLAAWSESEIFSVGVELAKTLGQEAEWRRLIADVRRFFPGQVTYASNWYGGLEDVGFWDALDAVGVDAYYPLAEGADATPEELALGARQAVAGLAEAARRHGKPVLLTEVGFAARRGAWVEPHDEGGELSTAHQAAAYRALLDALGRPPWLAGAFVWKAFSGPTHRGEVADFRFLDRPAETEIQRWFQAQDSTGSVATARETWMP